MIDVISRNPLSVASPTNLGPRFASTSNFLHACVLLRRPPRRCFFERRKSLPGSRADLFRFGRLSERPSLRVQRKRDETAPRTGADIVLFSSSIGVFSRLRDWQRHRANRNSGVLDDWRSRRHFSGLSTSLIFCAFCNSLRRALTSSRYLEYRLCFRSRFLQLSVLLVVSAHEGQSVPILPKSFVKAEEQE